MTVDAEVVSVSFALVELSVVETDVNVVNPMLEVVDVGTVGVSVTLTVNSSSVWVVDELVFDSVVVVVDWVVGVWVVVVVVVASVVVVVDTVVSTGCSETTSVGVSTSFSVDSVIFIVVSCCGASVAGSVVGASVVVVVVDEVSGLMLDSKIQPSGGVIGDHISEKSSLL